MCISNTEGDVALSAVGNRKTISKAKQVSWHELCFTFMLSNMALLLDTTSTIKTDNDMMIRRTTTTIRRNDEEEQDYK